MRASVWLLWGRRTARENRSGGRGLCKRGAFVIFSGQQNCVGVASADAHIVTIKRGLEGVIRAEQDVWNSCGGETDSGGNAAETDVASIGERRGFAICADPDDASEVAGAVREISRGAGKLQRMGEAARAAASDYDRVNELRKFVRIIEEARQA